MSPNKPYILFPDFSLRKEVLVFGLLTLLILVLRVDVLINFSSLVLGGVRGDAGIYFWLIDEIPSSLSLRNWFETSAFYPYSKTLAWSDNFIIPSLLAQLFQLLGLNKIASYNLLLLFAQAANGFSLYLLAYLISRRRLAAFLGGALFCTLSYFSSQLGHPQLQFFFVIPLGVFLFYLAVQKNSFLSYLCLTVFVALSFLVAVYYALFLSYSIAFFYLCHLFLHPEHFQKGKLGDLFFATLISAFVLLPFLLPYFQVASVFGKRELYEAYYLSAHALSYLSFSDWSIPYSSTSALSGSEAVFGIGIVLPVLALLMLLSSLKASKLRRALIVFGIALALCFFFSSLKPLVKLLSPDESSFLYRFILIAHWPNWLVALLSWACIGAFFYLFYRVGRLERNVQLRHFSDRDHVLCFAGLALLAFLLSLGPLGNPERGDLLLSPYAFLQGVLPGLSGLRAASRFGILVIFSFSLLSALLLSS